ncbi:MAG: hypothetical protein NC453_24675 [Muribaculum sp.]|nr:hypothetical protein [Muribaculum sp.]
MELPYICVSAYAYAQKRAIIHAKVANVNDADKNSVIELATLLRAIESRPLAPRKMVNGNRVQPCRCTEAQRAKTDVRGGEGERTPTHVRNARYMG